MATRFEHIPVEPPPRWLRMLETLVISLAIPALGFILHPEDPLLLESGTAWLLVAGPLLIGIRYGFAFGFGSALISVALIGAETWWRTGALVPDQAQALPNAVAVVLVGMLSGEMADTWQRRLRQLATINHDQATRLDEFVRHYHLLRVSHDQLAERLAANPFTLRDALHRLAQRFQHLAEHGAPLQHHGSEILSFLALNGRIQQAALIRLDEHHRPLKEAPVCYGGGVGIDHQDPMILACLEQREMLYAGNAVDPQLPEQGSLLAVVPLIDVHERIHALVAVTQMPFLDFHRGQLHLLAVLGAQLGDLLHRAEARQGHASPADLSASLARWVAQARRNHLPSLLVTLELPEALDETHGRTIIDEAFAQLRALDQGWVFGTRLRTTCLHILMPLADERAATAFAERLWQRLETQLPQDPRQEGVRLSHRLIDGHRSARALLDGLDLQERHHAAA